MYTEVNFDEIAEMMELDNDEEKKVMWESFYRTLHVFGFSVCKEISEEMN